MNHIEWNRDQRWTVEQIWTSEEGKTDKPDRGFTSTDIGNVMFLNFVGYLKGYFDMER